MGMNLGSGGKKGVRPEMNVTPLVDVVLVLLIIFMVIAPVVTKGLYVRFPPKPDDEQTQAMIQDLQNETLTLIARESGELWINAKYKYAPEERGDLIDKLERVLNARKDRVVYVDADDDVEFRRTLEAILAARAAKAAPVVMLTEPVKLGDKDR